MKLTPELVLGFTKAFLLTRYDKPKPVPAFHMDLWKLYCSPDETNIAVAAPRGHAKSTAGTIAFGLSALLFGWKSHLMIVSGTADQASAFLNVMKSELTTNDKLISAFGINQPLIKSTETEIIVSVGTEGKMFRVISKGSNQAMRGMLWEHTRPDLVLCDDLETDEIVYNQERRIKFRDWFLNVMYPAVSADGIFRVAGTILHMDSLLEGFMPKNTKEYPLIETPLVDYTNDPDTDWKSYRFRAHDKDFSHILWPTQFNQKWLESRRRMYKNMGNPDGYSQEYLNCPIDEATAYFRRQDLLPMDDDDKTAPMKYFVAGDFAISKKTSADYTVFVVIGVSPDGVYNVIDVRRGRWDTFEIVEEILTIQKRYSPEVFVFEKGQIWLAVEPVLIKEMYKPGVMPINFDTVTPVTDKLVRARPLQHRTKAGAIRFDKEADWYEGMEAELIQFPRSAHDDQVDSLAHLCHKINSFNAAPTYEEQEEMDYDDEYRTTGFGAAGRTSIGGY